VRSEPRGEAPGLAHHDFPCARGERLEHGRRYAGGLAGSRWSLEDEAARFSEARADLRQQRIYGQRLHAGAILRAEPAGVERLARPRICKTCQKYADFEVQSP